MKKIVEIVLFIVLFAWQLPQNLDIDAASQHLIMFFIGFLHQSRDNKVDKIKQDYAKYVDWEFNLLERITKDKDSSN